MAGWTKLDEYESELRGGRKLPMVIARNIDSGAIRHLTAEEYAAEMGATAQAGMRKPTATLIRKIPSSGSGHKKR